MLDEGPVVPGQVVLVLVLEINSQSVVRVAMLAIVGGTQSETGTSKGLGDVESSVKIPLFVPSLDDTIVEVQLEVVRGLHFGVERPVLGEVEPVLDFVTDPEGSLFGFDVGLEIECAFFSFRVDFESDELVVNEVISDEGVTLSGEISPGVDLDAFRL